VDDGATPLSDQVKAIVAGAQFLVRKWEERAHILRAVLQSIDQFEAVAALIRSSDSAVAARTALMDVMDFDEVQARAVTDMQVLKLARREHQELADHYDEAMTHLADLESTLASPERQRELIGTERGDYLSGQDIPQEDWAADGDDTH
jgi:DNA gyrase subunit A